MTDDSCLHDFLSIQSDALEYEGTRYLTVSVRCAGCHVLWSFRGINSGGLDPNEPTCTADAYQLRAPIEPRPGAIVGVLSELGLEDRLNLPTKDGGI